MERSRRLCWILYLSGFLDLCGVGMILSLIPAYSRDIGASTTLTGIIGSVYGGVQLLSSPVMGNWADGVSRKTSILLSLGFSFVGYCTMAMSTTVIILIVARVILGCFKHSQTMSRSYLAEVLSDKERSSVLGRFNSFSSIGMIVGPIIGGHVAESSGGFNLAAGMTAVTYALNVVLVWMVVPHSEPSKKSSLEDQEPSKQEKEGQRNSSVLLLAFWDLFLIIFFGSFSVLIYRNNFSLLLREKFLASPKTIGYITSYTGLVSTLCGFGVGKITERYKNNDAKLLLHVTILQLCVFIGLSLAPSVPLIILFLTPLSMSTSVARVATTSFTIQRCGKDQVASIMGWSQSVTSIARMTAPFIAGVIQEWSMDAACYVSVLAVCSCVSIMVIFPQNKKPDSDKRKD